MDSKEFKKIVNEIARKSGFESAFGAWFKESDECILSIDLQKSSLSKLYYLNIKIFAQGYRGKHYIKSKELLRTCETSFRRQPPEYDELFDLENTMDDSTRKKKLEEFFESFIIPFSHSALSKSGIIKLGERGLLHLNEVTKKAIGF